MHVSVAFDIPVGLKVCRTSMPSHLYRRELSGRVLDSGPGVRASPAALRCGP